MSVMIDDWFSRTMSSIVNWLFEFPIWLTKISGSNFCLAFLLNLGIVFLLEDTRVAGFHILLNLNRPLLLCPFRLHEPSNSIWIELLSVSKGSRWSRLFLRPLEKIHRPWFNKWSASLVNNKSGLPTMRNTLSSLSFFRQQQILFVKLGEPFDGNLYKTVQNKH